jgi:hypothetical protein
VGLRLIGRRSRWRRLRRSCLSASLRLEIHRLEQCGVARHIVGLKARELLRGLGDDIDPQSVELAIPSEFGGDLIDDAVEVFTNSSGMPFGPQTAYQE